MISLRGTTVDIFFNNNHYLYLCSPKLTEDMSTNNNNELKILCASYALEYVTDEVFLTKIIELLSKLRNAPFKIMPNSKLIEEDKINLKVLQSSFEMNLITEDIYIEKLIELIQPSIIVEDVSNKRARIEEVAQLADAPRK